MNSDKYPLISILIPFYNHNHFVQKTLDSSYNDTYPNKEIIIINDGSSNPDDSSIINWIKIHQSKISINYIKRENQGITKTLNELIKLSKGKYIAIIASDDYFVNNTFENRVRLLEKNPDKLMLISDAIVVNNDDEKIFDSAMFEQRGAPKKNYYTDKKLKLEIIKRWSCVGPTSFIDRKLYDTIGMYNEKFMIEDWDFYLRAVAQNFILFYDEQVAAYRWHQNNLSKDKESEYERDLCLCKIQKINIKNFTFPYYFILWRRSNKCFKRLLSKYQKQD